MERRVGAALSLPRVVGGRDFRNYVIFLIHVSPHAYPRTPLDEQDRSIGLVWLAAVVVI